MTDNKIGKNTDIPFKSGTAGLDDMFSNALRLHKSNRLNDEDFAKVKEAAKVISGVLEKHNESFTVRQAGLSDIDSLCEMINFWSKKGENLPRSREDLTRNIQSFAVCIKDEKVTGCACLYVYDSGLAEIRSLGVSPDCQGEGQGRALVEYLLDRARKFEIRKVFVLTRNPAFFSRTGFSKTVIDALPEKILKDCENCPKRKCCDEFAYEIELDHSDSDSSIVSRKTFDEVMFPCYVPYEPVFVSGKGSTVYDDAGNDYTDLSSGIAVSALGHSDKEVCKAIADQAKKLMHISNVYVNDSTLKAASLLTALTGFERVFFANSGAEANEAALKLARRYAIDTAGEEKNEIISFNQSFHGRTLFSVTAGGQSKYSAGFGPLPGAITHLPYNDKETFINTVSDKTCAVILEVIQGEGGIIPADQEFLKVLREECDKHHALLIFDEVQTGVGRTGSLYAYELTGVRPDILTSAKGIAAGLPLSAVLTSTEIASHFKPGTHGSTFGGNPVSCAAAACVLKRVSSPEFLSEVRAKGAELKELLEGISKEFNVFKEIRGRGLLLGAVLSDEYKGKAGELSALCVKHRVLTLTAGSDVLRLAPPLVITDAELKTAAERVKEAVAEFTAVK